MIPRADIIAATVKSTQTELAEIFKQSMHSRLPIYAATLDDIIGFVHIKDMINVLTKKDFHLKSVIRKVLFVSPSLRAMDLLYRMQSTSIHLAIVVDEYGGTDGLVTIDDILKKIVGDIDDEFETEDDPTIILQADGTYLADARVFIDDIEKMLQVKFSEQEHAESDTLGGLIFSFIGRIPVRGEVITHYVGLEFHILDLFCVDEQSSYG
jgi:magnesium and cobalt transporter